MAIEADQLLVLAKQIEETNTLAREQLKRAGNIGVASTITVKSSGMSTAVAMLLGAAITACFATWWGLKFVHDELRDTRAWVDLHTGQIAQLKAEKQK